ncbi:hypothetical protein LIER_15768 [Lithospermum erythrorhizon]|uniref:Uncharacterized protein n=1 Tax=Lithospermum erythrorhizon TaxID=34254 RepID=A0AAV3Q4I4_LITER
MKCLHVHNFNPGWRQIGCSGNSSSDSESNDDDKDKEKQEKKKKEGHTTRPRTKNPLSGLRSETLVLPIFSRSGNASQGWEIGT